MDDKQMKIQYELWTKKATEDLDVVNELKAIEGQDAKIEDAFYRDLAFGTGGLRGVIGAGIQSYEHLYRSESFPGISRLRCKTFCRSR